MEDDACMTSQTSTSPARRRLRSVVTTATAVVCVAAFAVGPASAAVPGDDPRSTLPKLRGWVGPGYDIAINRDSVPAGRYRMIVKDRGTIHNFHFFGAGVEHQTSVPGTGRHIWRVTLKPGTYTAACIPHGSMATTVTVA
jgi:hypothetical protein